MKIIKKCLEKIQDKVHSSKDKGLCVDPKQTFRLFFNKIKPEEFIAILGKEYIQTKAFILSFCPSRSYVKKVINLTHQDDREYIENYLATCSNEINGTEPVREIERYIEKIIERKYDASFKRK